MKIPRRVSYAGWKPSSDGLACTRNSHETTEEHSIWIFYHLNFDDSIEFLKISIQLRVIRTFKSKSCKLWWFTQITKFFRISQFNFLSFNINPRQIHPNFNSTSNHSIFNSIRSFLSWNKSLNDDVRAIFHEWKSFARTAREISLWAV